MLNLKSASLHYGHHALLDNVALQVNKGDRIGLVGRNGAGKSTLLKVLLGTVALEEGERRLEDGRVLSYLNQELPDADEQDVFDVVAHGLTEIGELLARYHHCTQAGAVNELAAIQAELDARDGWLFHQRVETTLTRLGLDGDAAMDSLSGGWRRRVALARAMVAEPDILLLDEPTNHLDIPAIEWLEKQLLSYQGAIIFVTHDRRFLSRLATRIAELDRGRLRIWNGDYAGFLDYREQQLAAEEQENSRFDKRLAEEEIWIRQGIKARRTRNEGRVRALESMREERSRRRHVEGNARMQLDEAERSGRRVAELVDVTHSYEGEPVLRDVSTLVSRGDRLGIVGPNGAGKTTLLRILLGDLKPNHGKVLTGTRLQIAYFDQLRAQLDPAKNLLDNICEGQDFLEIGGKRRHAISYLGDFLFAPDRVRMPVHALSGGEQNRAILARLFSQPANLLVLDEPTNDLDVETLELLEELLLAFKGTVLLVSHDREFMDRVVTGLLVLDGNGGLDEQAGGYSDWVARGGRLLSLPESGSVAVEPVAQQIPVGGPAAVGTGAAVKSKKLSYKEQREFDELPGLIENMEERVAALETMMASPAFFQRPHAETEALLAEHAELRTATEAAYERWEELADRA